MMYKCRCGVCQQLIPWESNKDMIFKGRISCQNCKTRLVFNGQAKLIGGIFSFIFCLSVICFLHILIVNEIVYWVILVLSFSVIGRYIDNIFIYAASQILSLKLVPQPDFRIW